MNVRAKKYLGQHFLVNENIAKRIADTLTESGYEKVLEIGPGTGMLTKYLLKKNYTTYVIEIDKESVEYLQNTYLCLSNRIILKNFLKINLKDIFNDDSFAIIGNFPYNISSQIVFKVLENKQQIPEFTGMFQKEVAERIATKQGSKAYGILSVLTQTFYDVKYLFTVPPSVFLPPPKVDSGVIIMQRKKNKILVNEKMLYKVVKTAFGQRRKKLSNSLKPFGISKDLLKNPIFSKRPEQLSVENFTNLTLSIIRDANS